MFFICSDAAFHRQRMRTVRQSGLVARQDAVKDVHSRCHGRDLLGRVGRMDGVQSDQELGQPAGDHDDVPVVVDRNSDGLRNRLCGHECAVVGYGIACKPPDSGQGDGVRSSGESFHGLFGRHVRAGGLRIVQAGDDHRVDTVDDRGLWIRPAQGAPRPLMAGRQTVSRLP